MKIRFQNRIIEIDGREIELEHRIKDAKIINEIIVVIFDFDENAPKHRQFKNCIALDQDGKKLWTAEHPTSSTSDFYVNFIKGQKNWLWNFSCYECEVDFTNGKLKNVIFTK